jgi:hypothetical protein
MSRSHKQIELRVPISSGSRSRSYKSAPKFIGIVEEPRHHNNYGNEMILAVQKARYAQAYPRRRSRVLSEAKAKVLKDVENRVIDHDIENHDDKHPCNPTCLAGHILRWNPLTNAQIKDAENEIRSENRLVEALAMSLFTPNHYTQPTVCVVDAYDKAEQQVMMGAVRKIKKDAEDAIKKAKQDAEDAIKKTQKDAEDAIKKAKQDAKDTEDAIKKAQKDAEEARKIKKDAEENKVPKTPKGIEEDYKRLQNENLVYKNILEGIFLDMMKRNGYPTNVNHLGKNPMFDELREQYERQMREAMMHQQEEMMQQNRNNKPQ